LAAIHALISRDSEVNAHRVIDRKLKRGDQISPFPFSGRVVPHSRHPKVRELIEPPYRIVYRVGRMKFEVIDSFSFGIAP
jgi:hypothetical protein